MSIPLDQIPEGYALADGHVYKVYYRVGEQVPSDLQLARALATLGVVNIEHALPGGTDVLIPITTEQKENA